MHVGTRAESWLICCQSWADTGSGGWCPVYIEHHYPCERPFRRRTEIFSLLIETLYVQQIFSPEELGFQLAPCSRSLGSSSQFCWPSSPEAGLSEQTHKSVQRNGTNIRVEIPTLRLLSQVIRQIHVVITHRVLDLQPLSFPNKNLAEELVTTWTTYSPMASFLPAERPSLMQRNSLSPVEIFSMALHSTAITTTARQIIPKFGTSRHLMSMEATQEFLH